MGKDPRYDHSLAMWQFGKITVFSELFKWIPKTVVARDMNIDIRTMNRYIADPALLTSENIDRLSDLYMLPRSIIKKLIKAQPKVAPIPPGRRRGRPPAQ